MSSQVSRLLSRLLWFSGEIKGPHGHGWSPLSAYFLSALKKSGFSRSSLSVPVIPTPESDSAHSRRLRESACQAWRRCASLTQRCSTVCTGRSFTTKDTLSLFTGFASHFQDQTPFPTGRSARSEARGPGAISPWQWWRRFKPLPTAIAGCGAGGADKQKGRGRVSQGPFPVQTAQLGTQSPQPSPPATLEMEPARDTLRVPASGTRVPHS